MRTRAATGALSSRRRRRCVAVDVLTDPVGALVELERVRAHSHGGRLVQVRRPHQHQDLSVLVLSSRPAHSNIADAARVVLDLVCVALPGLELARYEDMVVTADGDT